MKQSVTLSAVTESVGACLVLVMPDKVTLCSEGVTTTQNEII
jgi:hypothetical protein